MPKFKINAFRTSIDTTYAEVEADTAHEAYSAFYQLFTDDESPLEWMPSDTEIEADVSEEGGDPMTYSGDPSRKA